MLVSGVCHLHSILCAHHPRSPSVTVHLRFTLLPPSAPFPAAITTLLSVSLRVFWLNPLTVFTQPPKPLPSDSYQSVLCL